MEYLALTVQIPWLKGESLHLVCYCILVMIAAAVNCWSEAEKLKWLPLSLSQKARSTFRQLPSPTWSSYRSYVTSLKERLDPLSNAAVYRAELENRKKRAQESWSDIGRDIRRP
ncbi:deoxyribonuclease II superfamily, partial [Trichinella spiralis]|uniref:deoxyribonuclease II superfamily n=1 Tax=Trichinella spiralis TaxID=6334 RepID=UPI0001EFD95B